MSVGSSPEIIDGPGEGSIRMGRVLIIHNGPIGSLVDAMKWCETLRHHYEVYYLELDGVGRVPVEGVHTLTVPSKGSRIFRGLRFLFYALVKTVSFRGAVIVVFFPGCWLLKAFCFWRTLILDVRTLSVRQTEHARKKENAKIRFACKLYNHVTIIQEDLIKELRLPAEKFSIVPLGSDVISDSDKTFDSIRLLYVGTLDGRHIDETITGVRLFLERNPGATISYDIVGDGREYTKDDLMRDIAENGLSEYITAYGRILNSELKPFFDKNNVGVSFVPRTPWFDHQPPTKTFEYITSGLYCIATNTTENARIINSNNGCLHEDNAEGFCQAIERTQGILPNIKSSLIKESIKGFSWPEIVARDLIPVIEKYKA